MKHIYFKEWLLKERQLKEKTQTYITLTLIVLSLLIALYSEPAYSASIFFDNEKSDSKKLSKEKNIKADAPAVVTLKSWDTPKQDLELNLKQEAKKDLDHSMGIVQRKIDLMP
jgi:hypothetical protein